MVRSKIYYDKDVDLSLLTGKTIAVIGYGNQGRSHALNYRDSGLNVIVGCRKDDYWKKAEEEGFEVYPIGEAAERGDILYVAIPDEVQPQIYEEEIRDNLSPGNVLVFAHGFNIHYGFIEVRRDVDVVMEAPRMIGEAVRAAFVEGKGFPTYIAVHNDSSGKAKEIVLALAKAVGATRLGAFESSFEEETVLDLLLEQGLVAGIMGLYEALFRIAVEAGYNPEVVALELYKSGEIERLFYDMKILGLYRHIPLHSQTAQYGTLTRIPKIVTEEVKNALKERLKEIQDGTYAREWVLEYRAGYPVFKKLRKRCFDNEINKVEDDLDKILKK